MVVNSADDSPDATRYNHHNPFSQRQTAYFDGYTELADKQQRQTENSADPALTADSQPSHHQTSTGKTKMTTAREEA